MSTTNATELESFIYVAFGLRIKSAIRLPAIECYSDAKIDVEIVIGNVTNNGVKDASLQKAFSQANEKQFWLDIPFIGKFLVEQGRRIVVQPVNGVDVESVVSVLKGTCFQILLIQRHTLVYAGTAVSFKGNSILLLGGAGSGKSSLAVGLQKKGLSIICDDLVTIDKGKSVNQGWSQVSLWQNSCDALGINSALLKRVRSQINKFYLKLPMVTQSQLHAIYILQSHNKPIVELNEIKGMNKFSFLAQQNEKMEYWELFANKQLFMSNIVSLVQNTRLITVSVPIEGDCLEVAGSVMQDLKKSFKAGVNVSG